MRILKQMLGVLSARKRKYGRTPVMLFCWVLLMNFEASNFSFCAAQDLSGYRTAQTPTQMLAGIVAEEAAAAQVDPRLVWAIITNESGFNPSRVSGKGAAGLMQLMPQTAQRFGVSNSFNARQNVRGGARYLAFLLGLFNGNATLAIAAYNAGEGAVIKYGRKIPPYKETQEYVRRLERNICSLDPAG